MTRAEAFEARWFATRWTSPDHREAVATLVGGRPRAATEEET